MIKVENLTIKYKEKVIAKNINFEIKKGDYFLILGENGSGKTSLIKSILNQNTNFEGKIVINDVLNSKIKDWSNVGYVTQKTNISHDLPLTTFEYLNMYTDNSEKIKKIVEKNDLTHVLNNKINNLSGGEFQRINIIKEILKDIDYLFLDEPESNLDKESKQQLFDNLENLNKKGITIIIITHGETKIKGVNKVYNMKTKETERR